MLIVDRKLTDRSEVVVRPKDHSTQSEMSGGVRGEMADVVEMEEAKG